MKGIKEDPHFSLLELLQCQFFSDCRTESTIPIRTATSCFMSVDKFILKLDMRDERLRTPNSTEK